ncbi:MAG: hypothetical protein JSW06_03960 [Thermoplasmatales archaeon]|nr:MAG: hypothetical protein JSW06_03960 [Thermoplasmatales archaeon]
MRKYLFSTIFAIGVIILIVGAGIVSSISVKKNNDSSLHIDSAERIIVNYNNIDDDNRHFYFFVRFNITIYRRIFCNYCIFDIQGLEFVPFFTAIKLDASSGIVVDVTIWKMNGQKLEFSLSNRVVIFALQLKNVETNLPKFDTVSKGYFEGRASFIKF